MKESVKGNVVTAVGIILIMLYFGFYYLDWGNFFHNLLQ